MRLGRAAVAFLLALATFRGEAQTPARAEADEIIWHDVVAGDTLEALTARYLGDASLWRENWKLNPDVKDPHQLRPGQRIRIIVKRQQPTAEIRGVSRKVESKPQADPTWTPARVGEVLKEKDGVRTYEKSSADLGFADGSRLVVTEQSLVFLREIGARLVGAVTRRAVEIVDGQAEIQAKGLAEPAAGIEFVIGGARALAQPGAGKGMETRVRKSASGGSQVMVFEGQTDVEAGGKSVLVPSGMGTSVPRGGTPTAPEKLLPAPELLAPVAGTAYGQANPRFSWKPVAGAQSYTVEVCVDAECGQVVDRATRVAGTRWSPDGLPLGEFRFRVMAVSASGLDGLPSTTPGFRIESLWRRPDPTRRQ